ncbi:unnamed protein product [Brachionus calyciflorus]|uniref:Uncharacterized protein n=1 Tax=Brachionus calyciflorus TaxID=104777 RepID=A0A814LGG7_9BILA|nr:unnamed protein product [Brachionus calyciflorus]
MFTFKLLQYKYRRKLYFCFMLISGVFCTMIFYSKNVTLTTTCAMIAKFSIACTYAIIRLYSSEYFPENLRKNYLTKCSIMARTGSVIAPFIIALGDYFIKPLPFLIFGCCCFISALTTLFLPRIQKENIRKQEVRIDLNQQLIQNNWLDGQDIELEKTDNNIDSLDEIEIKEIN